MLRLLYFFLLQIPIGLSQNSKGVVDLINFKGIVLDREDQGRHLKEVDIPTDLIDETEEHRANLLEAVAEFDESLMEKYFEDEESLTERNIKCT